MFNCWAQEYAARPSAGEIVSILESPADCLKLSNAYNTELPYSAVSAALVVTVDNQQSLWLAHKNKIEVYKFSDPDNSIGFFKVNYLHTACNYMVVLKSFILSFVIVSGEGY